MDEAFVIDAGPMGGGISGAGRYAYRMLDELLAMDTEIPFEVIVPPPERHDWDVSGWDDQDNVTLRPAAITGLGPRRHLFYARNRLSCRVHHSLSSYVPLVLDADRTLVTIHDLKEFAIPEYLAGKSRLKRAYIKRLMIRSVRVADHVITVSEHTKGDILDRFDIDESDVSVIPLGPGGGRRPTDGEPPVPQPYVLFVGAVRRHKNVETLIEGFQTYRRRVDSPLALAIAGSPVASYQQDLEATIDEKYRDDVYFLGHVDDDVVARLYANASAFVFPSLYEGFGLPPLEAMAYETPVIAADRASIPEVVGDAAALFDATDAEDLASAMETVLGDDAERRHLVEKGRDRVGAFSWKRTARETLALYERIWDADSAEDNDPTSATTGTSTY